MRLKATNTIGQTSLSLSGSKSISNRLLVLSALLNSDQTVENLSTSEDTQLLQKALQQIKDQNQATIDIHHAGTDMRFLTAYLSVTPGEWMLTGSERMKQRPIGELVTALRTLGAEINYLEKENYPPLLIKGKTLNGGDIEIESSVSSQFISALLLIACKFKNGLKLNLKGKTVSQPYIDMTVELLKQTGIQVSQKEKTIQVIPFDHIPKVMPQYFVESDWSSASYWYSICALLPDSKIELTYFHPKSLQADSILPELYKNLGVKTIFKENAILLSSETVLAKEFYYDFTNCPDIAQTVAVTCFALGIRAELTGLSTLKVKETDRLFALKTELEKFGAQIQLTSDSLSLKKSDPQELKNKFTDPNTQLIRTYNDHRMAMSFAPLALVVKEIMMDDSSVVAKSYPRFWEDLKSVGFSVNLHP
ncbi:3-phosphoshikimate 1-carboxyvinyltransferase [Sphingobacteriaceae bacterium]|nr:3-phosphoshikimate 1-carboxyvinyltransferase [Sphingobacteriaceae bacterium]